MNKRRERWDPKTNMDIESVYSNGHGRPQGRRARIVEVLPNGFCRIEHASGKRTYLSEASRLVQWQPVKAPLPTAQLSLAVTITEADVRRIVREELRILLAPKEGAS